MNETTTQQIPQEVSNVYNRALLMRVTPYFVHTKWAQIKDIAQKSGTQTIKFRRYGNLSVQKTPITEGITPVGSKLSVTDITATTEQYGDYIKLTDVVQYQTEDPILVETAQILGDQASDTLDQLCRDVMAAGTNVHYAESKTQRSDVANTSVFAILDILKIVRTLKNANAKKMTTMVDPSNGYNTVPLQPCFIGLVHPNTVYGMKQLAAVGQIKFNSVETYASSKAIMDAEVGAIDEVRFIETTNAKIFAGQGNGGIDVYATLILARDAYGVTRISGKALENIVKPLGAGDDPLNQRSTSGWKATFVAKILNNSFLVRYEHAVSA